MSNFSGRCIWYENLTRDVPAGVALDTTVAGWNTQSRDGMGEPYDRFANGDGAFAGLQPMPPTAEAPPHWPGYRGTPDVKDTTALAESLGATSFARSMEIPTVGTISGIQDPQGAPFALHWKREQRRGCRSTARPAVA